MTTTLRIPTIGRIGAAFAALLLALAAPVTWAQGGAKNAVESINFSQVQGGKIIVKVGLREALAATPQGFAVTNPPRIAIDLPDTVNALNRNQIEASVESFGRISVARRASIQALSNCAMSAYCLIRGIASFRTQRSWRIGALANQASDAIAATAPTQPSTRAGRGRRAEGTSPLGVAIDSIAASNSSADWKRSAGSFSRHFSTVRRSDGGTSARPIAGGALVRCALITACGVPAKGGCPSSIS